MTKKDDYIEIGVCYLSQREMFCLETGKWYRLSSRLDRQVHT